MRTVLSEDEQAPTREAPGRIPPEPTLGLETEGQPMDAHPAHRSPALFLALLPVLLLLGELSCGGSPSGITRAPAPSDVSAAPEQASAEPTDRGLAAAQRHIAQREYRASENGEGLQAPTVSTTCAPTSNRPASACTTAPGRAAPSCSR